jgi:hypothetical protein
MLSRDLHTPLPERHGFLGFAVHLDDVPALYAYAAELRRRRLGGRVDVSLNTSAKPFDILAEQWVAQCRQSTGEVARCPIIVIADW